MKYLKNILLLSILLICNTFIYAQKPFMDSIRVQVDDKAEVELAVNEYKDLAVNIERDLKSLRSILNASDAIPKESYTITYQPDKLVSIKQSGQPERIIWKDGETNLPQFNNQCIIKSDGYSLHIWFNDIESLTSDQLVTSIKKVIDTTEATQGRFASTYNYAYQGNNFVHHKQLDKTNGQLDQLSFSGGVGLNMIKNKPVLDLSAEVGVLFSRKGILRNNYYLSYNQLSHFDDENKLKLNSFANVGYRYNLSNDVKKPNWLGVEVGYLVNRQGDFFDQNTFKLGVNWQIGKYISVQPELYISDKATYPGLRIGFGF